MIIRQPNPFTETPTGVQLTTPVVLTCSCGPVTARYSTICSYLPNPPTRIVMKYNPLAIKWAKENDLYTKIPQLAQHTFGVFVTPSLKFVDITRADPLRIANNITALLSES